MSRGNTPHSPQFLTVGTHLAPDDGACLMELVSRLAGQPWSDAPPTTLPLLAHLGRLVNDAMTEAGRQALVPLAPRLAGLSSAHPTAEPHVVVIITRYALDLRPSLRLAWMHAAARRHVRLAARLGSGGPVIRLRHRVYLHGPAQRALESAVLAVCRGGTDRDDHLCALMDLGIADVEADAGSGRQVPATGAGRASSSPA
jgi:hypothetical protein